MTRHQTPLVRSLYRQVPKDTVKREYEEASRLTSAFEKAKWGSDASMLNRFRLGLRLANWASARRWLDVGCGVGVFFSLAEDEGHRFQQLVGIDLIPGLIKEARQRPFASPNKFLDMDLERLPKSALGQFDLITLVGVLQQCGCHPQDALMDCARVLRPGGQLFLTTKHLGWRAFSEDGLIPEPGHSWFDYDEMAEILTSEGMDVVNSGGFLPEKGVVVPLPDSHTMFILGEKRR